MSDDAPVIVVREPGRVPLHVVVTQPLEIGRDSSGLVVTDPQVSRRHVELRPTAAGIEARDLGSTHGTRIDGQPLVDPTILGTGSVVQIGNTSITLAGSRSGMRDDLAGGIAQTSLEKVASSIRPAEVVEAAVGSAQTVTIAFSDIERSTELASSMGDRRWYDVLSSHNDVIVKAVDRQGGRVVKSQGDGFMMVFPSSRGAIDALIEMQRAFESTAPGELIDAIHIRAGAHVGEAILDDDGDLFGRHVNIAARVAAKASGGEILVSSLVREIVEARGDLRFGEPRTVALKGVSDEYQVHPIEWALV